MSYAKRAYSVYDYFLDLERDGHHTLGVFQEAFMSLATQRLSAKKLAIILYRTALHIGECHGRNAGEAHDLQEVVQARLPVWTAKATEHVAPHASNPFIPWDLSNIIWAFARLNLHPTPEFMQAWRDSALTLLRHDKFSVLDITSSIWALGTLGIHPGQDFMNTWVAATDKYLLKGEMDSNAQGLSNSAWALAILHAMAPNSRVQNFAHDLLACHKRLSDRRCGMTQTAQARAYFTHNPRLTQGGYVESSTRSRQETVLVQAFRLVAPALKVCDKTTIPSLSHRPDMVLSDGGKRAIIEYDGPFHYVSGRMNGGTILMSALMEKHCPDDVIVRLPYWVNDEWIGKLDTCRSNMRTFISGAFDQAAGAYAFDRDRGFVRLFDDNGQGERHYSYTALRLAA